MAERKVASCGGVVLRKGDLELLAGPLWLNDNILEFVFAHLSQQLEEEEEGKEKKVSRDVLLVGPSVTFWLLHCGAAGEDVGITARSLDMSSRKFIMFALNDNEAVTTAEGGSHWSLVLFNRDANTFQHFDSGGVHNHKAAFSLLSVLRPFLGPSAVNCRLTLEPTPQQANGYDCGMYVLANCRFLLNAIKDENHKAISDFAKLLKEKVSRSYVRSMRKELYNWIAAYG